VAGFYAATRSGPMPPPRGRLFHRRVHGPLFVNFDRAGKGHRLTGAAVYHIVGWLGAKAGLTVRPHGLRHLAITTALDRTNGDVRAVAKFSRHQDLRTLSRYRDNRPDLAGDVAALVAAE
jgi:integrase/recombinase XerC